MPFGAVVPFAEAPSLVAAASFEAVDQQVAVAASLVAVAFAASSFAVASVVAFAASVDQLAWLAIRQVSQATFAFVAVVDFGPSYFLIYQTYQSSRVMLAVRVKVL